MATSLDQSATGLSGAHNARVRRRRARMRRFVRTGGGPIGLFMLVVMTVCAVAAPLIAPHDPNAQDILNRLVKPFSEPSEYLLGSDQLGRDILSRLIYGSRVSLLVGLSSVLIAGVVGIVLGLLSGYYGGRIDSIISWLANVQLSFPFILLVIALVAVIGAGLLNVIIVLGLASWVVYQRVVRGEVLVIREREYVEAARVIGARDAQIIVRHVLPNVLTPMIVIGTLQIGQMIIAEAALSFLGLGVQPGIPSWGSMLADGRSYLTVAWWVATIPGLAIVVTVLAINLLGDWLRDELDPRLTT